MIAPARQFIDDLKTLDRRSAFAFVYAAIGLTCINYFKNPEYLESILSGTSLSSIGSEAAHPTSNNLYSLLWWIGVSMIFYVVVPSLWVRFVQRRRLSDIGLAPHIEKDFLLILGICIIIMLPLTWAMSHTAGFAAKYPFLRIYDNSPYWGKALLIWEPVYFLQFFGLEFFFRGFLVHSFKDAIGKYSILAMTVPYTMIHFGKPLPETFAAIFAGLFLGWLSYRNGTIWLGLILHCFVALSMDILALYNKGLIFN